MGPESLELRKLNNFSMIFNFFGKGLYIAHFSAPRLSLQNQTISKRVITFLNNQFIVFYNFTFSPVCLSLSLDCVRRQRRGVERGRGAGRWGFCLRKTCGAERSGRLVLYRYKQYEVILYHA